MAFDAPLPYTGDMMTMRALAFLTALGGFAAAAEMPTLKVTFPSEGTSLQARGQTYVIGAVTPADTPVTINGQTVTPWRTGSFLAMVPVTPGTNTLVCQAGCTLLRRTFTIPLPPPRREARGIGAVTPSQPLGVNTGETVRLACLAPAGLAVAAAVGERVLPLKADPNDPTRYAASLSFDAAVEKVPVVFFAEGLADAPAGALTARATWPAQRVTGPLFETRVRSEPGDGDTVGFLPDGCLLRGNGFIGPHARVWLDGQPRFVDTRFLTEAPDAPLPPRDQPLPDIAAGFGPHPPTNRTPSQVLIVIDPGHGGPATGALGPSGLTEKEANLRQALLVKEVLERAGYRIRLTRDSDVDVDLYERARIAYAAKADAFISIHHNATPASADPRESRHVSAYAWNDIGLQLARPIHARIAPVTAIPDRGVMQASFAVCRNPAIPSCLLELDFINCPEGEEAILDANRQRRIAEAILAGLTDWLAAPTD